MAGEEGRALPKTAPETAPETAEQQVLDAAPVLPFEDEPATFGLVLMELAERLAPDDEE
jgi:hypothetical protein